MLDTRRQIRLVRDVFLREGDVMECSRNLLYFGTRVRIFLKWAQPLYGFANSREIWSWSMEQHACRLSASKEAVIDSLKELMKSDKREYPNDLADAEKVMGTRYWR